MTLSVIHELLRNELGPLTTTGRKLADEFFTTLLNNLRCDDSGRTILRDPGPIGARERILGYLEQLVPGLRDSDLGREVERALNALMVRLRAHMPSERPLGTV